MSDDIYDKVEMMSRSQLEREYIEAENEIERLKKENEQLREISNKEIPIKPVLIRFEGEDTMSCPKCGNFSIRLLKYCNDCGQRLNQCFETHENYSGV